MTILILHAIGGHAGDHWEQWLNDELTKLGHKVIMPQLPNSKHPDRQTWDRAVAAAADGVDPSELVIVGHSLGVPTALDYIERLHQPIRGFVSVAGWAYDIGTELNSYYMRERTIDFDKVRPNILHAVVFYSDDDPYLTQQCLKDLATELRVDPIVIPKGGHLNTDAGYTTFPELLDKVTAI